MTETSIVSRIGELTRLKQGPGVTLSSREQTRQTWWQTFPSAGGRQSPIIGGIDVRSAHGLPRKLTEGQAPHQPFEKLSGGAVLISQLEQSPAEAGSGLRSGLVKKFRRFFHDISEQTSWPIQYVGRSVMNRM